MKKPIPVYCYQHKEFVAKAPSLQGAAIIADTSITSVRKIINQDIDCTRDGWVFSLEELTPEEMEHMPDSHQEKQKLTRVGKQCRKDVENQSYEVSCNDGKVVYLPAARKDRITLLRKFIFTKLYDRWMILPKKVATLEKQMARELLDSLE